MKFGMFDKVRFVRDSGMPDPPPAQAPIEPGPGEVRSFAYRGEIGTIVETYSDPREGYEVEVMKVDSYYTLALVTAPADDLELVERYTGT